MFAGIASRPTNYRISNKTNMEELAKQIAKLRKQKRLSRRELSLFAGVSGALIVDIESARISRIEPDILWKLAKTLDADYGRLLLLAGCLKKLDKSGSCFINVQTFEGREEKLECLEFIRSNHIHDCL